MQIEINVKSLLNRLKQAVCWHESNDIIGGHSSKWLHLKKADYDLMLIILESYIKEKES